MKCILGDVPYRTDDDVRLNRRTPIPLALTENCTNAIEALLEVNHEKRIPLCKIMKLKFFNQFFSKSESNNSHIENIIPV